MRGTNKADFLKSARADMIDAAMKLGKTRAEAAALADRLLGLDKIRAVPKIDADTRAALSGIGVVTGKLNEVDGKRAEPSVGLSYGDVQAGVNAVSNLLASIDGDSATVTTYHRTVNTGGGKYFKNADGGTIPKTGLGYADRHLRLLADGEEVISNRYGQADRNRDLLKAINANRYADGGTVGGRRMSVTSSVNLGDVRIRGTLDTPWGPADIEGMIEDRIGDYRAHDNRPATTWAGVTSD